MTPNQHQRLCLGAMAVWTVAGALAGVLKFGWPGLLWAIPGLLIGAIVHKAVMESLPIRCPHCAGRVEVHNFVWTSPWGTPGRFAEGSPADTDSQRTTWYQCRQCKFEQKAERL